jgi:hypothetical protein
MTGVSPLKVGQSIWIRSGLTDQQYIFRSIRDALIERGTTVLTLNGPKDADGLEKIRRAAWSSDAHVIMDGMTPGELHRLRPIFESRKNFSMALVDWWTSVYWFTLNANYLFFRNYNGIAARRGLAGFAEGQKPPLWSPPENTAPYELASAALRLPALLVAPLLQLWKRRQRRLENIPRERLLYFPFTLAAGHVPAQRETPEFDFCNVSSTRGYWILRDPHASAWLNFANLYHDRARITRLLQRTQNPACTVFDVRRAGRLDWDGYCQLVRKTRYAICTGGLHQNSVAKYAEFACLGTPLFGESLPFEYPWLDQCLFPVDTLRVTPAELKQLLPKAMEQQPALRENCLALRETLLQLYNPHRVLDLLQEQADGKPIPPGYLKPAATRENL